MSEEAKELPQPETRPGRSVSPDATVLRFPSNRPLDQRIDGESSPRLRDVIGEVLRDERHRQERTLADVADRAAVSLPYLSEVERGTKEVSSDLLDAIGTALQLPLVEILERSTDRLRTEATARTRSGEFRMERSACFQLAA